MGSSDKNAVKPTANQLEYLTEGLKQPGGKLPLFDKNGKAIANSTVRACIDKGWAEAWFSNPLKPDWLVCKLTDEGYKILNQKQSN